MYNAVFSALMTITGLTFAAIGLLLEGRERHWMRHAQVWRSLRFKGLLPVAVAVVLTSGFVLWRIDITSDSFSLWWWITIVLFVMSLGALGWSLILTRRLVEPTSILERLRRRLFTEQKMSAKAESSVSDYMVVVKELLIGTLGEGDTNNYRVTHERGLVNPSCPPRGLEDCVSAGFSDATRIRVVGMLAADALGEARAQFDASSGNRTVNLICADTMTSILNAWSQLEVAEIEEGDQRTATEAALSKVMKKGCDTVSRSLAGALGVQRPSQTLVDRLSDTMQSVLLFVDGTTAFAAIERVLSAAERAASAGNEEEACSALGVLTPGVLHSVDPRILCDAVSRSLAGALGVQRPSQTLVDSLNGALKVVLPLVDDATALVAIERVLSAAERAASAGNEEEACSALGVLTPGVLHSVDSMVLVVRALLAEHRKVAPSSGVIAILNRLVMDWMGDTSRTDSDKSKLAQLVTPDLVATVRSLTLPENRAAGLVSVIAEIVPRLEVKKPLDALLAELRESEDAVLELFMKHVYAHSGDLLVQDRDQALYNFLLDRLRNSPVDADGAVRAVVSWLDPTAVHLARVRPERLALLRKHACAALRRVYTPACNVNPVFLSVIFARVRAERATLRDGSAPLPALPDGTLTNPADGSRDRSASPSARVPVSQVLWHCYDVFDKGLALARDKGVPVPFSVEVRRSALGSLSLLFCDLDELVDEDVAVLLSDEKLVWSVETAFELGVHDLGDVSLYLDRIRAAAGVATGLIRGRSVRARNLRVQWQKIGLRCERSLAVGGFGRPPVSVSVGNDQLMEGGVPDEAAPSEIFSLDASPTALTAPPQRLLDVLSRHVDVPGGTGPVDEKRAAEIDERVQILSGLLDRRWGLEAPEVEVMGRIGDLTITSGTRLFTEDEAREVACLVMADLVLQRLPKWAVRLRELADRAVSTSDAELMFMVLRTSRSSLAGVKGVRDAWVFSAKSPFYVFSDKSLDGAALLTNGMLAMEAAISDWILGGINKRPGGVPLPDETDAELTSIVGATVAAMERRFRKEQHLMRRIPSFWNVAKDVQARLAVAAHPTVADDEILDDVNDAEA